MSEVALQAVRSALAGESAWIVGGAVRDALLGRPVADVDVAVAGGDARAAAKALARAVGGPVFELSGAFGAWRVIGPDRDWQVDLTPLQGATLDEDLARRDFTVNAMARPLAEGGEVIDPFGGAADLAEGRLRMVAAASFDDDPLRVLRLARFACELGLQADPATITAARERAPQIVGVAAERVFAELKRVIAADRVLDGLALMDALGLTEHVLPELSALRGVEQNRYHHLDVHDHTLEVLAETVALERDPGATIGDDALNAPLLAFLAEPFSDELTRGTALRFGAILHDVAKPETQAFHEDGSVLGFPGHADLGAERSRAALARLKASEKLRAHVALLARHHLGLGYLVHKAPLDPRTIHQYLVRTAPVEVDVSLLSIADRLATRGRKADEAIAKHLAVARLVLPAALAYAAWAAQPPLIRGDELARALSMKPGPALGALLAQLDEARYAGAITTADEAVALARTLI
ncbi:CC-adding tRNA nucleotidyltransferase [Baekduia alba]|uniref:HD domain-containing protein n=1 Tax=Baekduia alba TaxID=2997333 RepID=UPI002340563E|nr:HD domain-containing protein [Baekduia alba]WCB95569.1 CC-adding tRNA nucleotidyltransferase [Baekduia alba]